MSAKIKRPWGGYIQCLFIIFCGLCCHAVVMACNFAQGQTFGQDDLSRNIWGFASLAIDFVGVCVFSMWAGKLSRSGQRRRSFIVSIAVLGCGCYSLYMFDGYGAVTRIEPSREAELQISADLDAHKQSVEASKEARGKVADILHSELHTSLETGLKKGASADQRSAAGIQSQSFLERLAGFATVTIAAPKVGKDLDPQATRLALHTGWKKDTAQEVASLFLGGLLLILGSLAVRMGVQDWPKDTNFLPARYLQPYRPPAQPGRPMLTLVPETVSAKRAQTVIDALSQFGRPVSNIELAKFLNITQAEASRRVTSLGKRVDRIRCGRVVQISLATVVQPKKFSTYFNRGNSGESAVKGPEAKLVSLTG